MLMDESVKGPTMLEATPSRPHVTALNMALLWENISRELGHQL